MHGCTQAEKQGKNRAMNGQDAHPVKDGEMRDRMQELTPSVTIVITVFNRAYCVSSSIHSALNMRNVRSVVIVDDASTDNSLTLIQDEFSAEIECGKVILVSLERNVGVTGAKNAGYAIAKTDWVIFLDSDDLLMPDISQAMLCELSAYNNNPIVFFRCQDQNGKLVGANQGLRLSLDLRSYIKCGSFGEALTAVNKRLHGEVPPYPQELRGYEGLGCCRIIRKFGPAILSPVVARVYYSGSADALSSLPGMLKRAKYLAIGHWIMSCEFRREMRSSQAWMYRIKAAVYMAGHFVAAVAR